jgi:NADPH2 dehydrogenase
MSYEGPQKHIECMDRFTSLKFRNGKQLENRIVVPPMASETADCLGRVTQATLDHYARLTQSRAGLVMVEYTYVHRSGRSEPHQLGIDCDGHIEGLREIAKIIRASGQLAGIQLTHSGGKTSRDLTDGRLMGPSRVAVPVKDREMAVPDPMSEEDIQLWKASFIEGAHRAVLAGFDLVEIHAAHGYGINQWLSPITNLRTDEYGGSVEKGRRLLLEIVGQLRFLYPDLLLAVRMPGQDFLPGGLSTDDGVALAKRLQCCGLDIIDVSSGIGGWRRPGHRSGQGYLVAEAARIQSEGGIEEGEYVDSLVSRGDISLAAVGRAILKDPRVWGESQLPDQLVNKISICL